MPAIHIVVASLLSLQFAGCASAADDRKVLEEKGDAKTQKQAATRRAVPMMIERPPVATPPAPRTTVPTVPPTAVPQGPSPITGCDPGGCWSGGSRYEGKESVGGGTYLDRSGKLCQSHGTWMQCF